MKLIVGFFYSGTIEPASAGLSFTWFNQRATNPIHIKLDRMLINYSWLEKYPTSFYKVESPGCSDHSPLVLCFGDPLPTYGRFLFKNYWINMEGYWNGVISIISKHSETSQIANLYFKLKNLKAFLN
ncbi:hypothetical protein MA16_Dca004379 [Dendrobium catenatum]|uniref:Uncharacterized protein n=1 Tax=Dendrobium catenatum TaxID=906689 RepID=A0A2I0W797_9ASPA|nr:hypothetical protein MA16_Dca004379 [Dendrobium catenatum]